MDNTDSYKYITAIIQNFTYGFLGIMLGSVVNTVSVYAHKHFHLNKHVSILMQLFLCAFLLGVIGNLDMMKDFGMSWQSTVPGLFFVAFFFNGQYHIYDIIRRMI